MTKPAKTYRFYVRSRDGRALYGFDTQQAAETAALAYGAGALIIDTMAQAYIPMLHEVVPASANTATAKPAAKPGLLGGFRSKEQAPTPDNAEFEIVYAGFGGWDTGRFGVDRDLIEGIKKGHVAIVEAFLAKGAEVNACDKAGGPALHWAVGGGKLSIVKLLLERGADLQALDQHGQSALQLAQKRGRKAIIEALSTAIDAQTHST